MLISFSFQVEVTERCCTVEENKEEEIQEMQIQDQEETPEPAPLASMESTGIEYPSLLSAASEYPTNDA